MDEFLDHLISSSSWSDVNATERPSWVGSGPSQTNGILSNSIGVYEGDETSSPMSMISSNHIMGSLTTQSSSIFVGGDSKNGLERGLLTAELQAQKESPTRESKPSLNEVVNGSSKAGYFDLRLNMNTSTLGELNHSSPNPMVGGSAKLPHSLPGSSSIGNNDGEPSEFQPSFRDSHSLPSIPQLWLPPSYGGVSSLPSIMGQDKLPGFGLQGEYKGQDELHNYPLSSFAAGHQTTLTRTDGLPSQLQHALDNAGSGCDRAVKPRARARRGQATDPHSIAERLRREKISERMKNLQELVPNSNKADKASMLDEIIEYVKFLQLQVKVLSMSRLGAAGAVVPLLTDGQAEGSSGLLSLSSQGADISESPEMIALEQEVMKLMESNMTDAMQYLQSKGLCLMPIALATAISSEKASSGPVSGEINKPGFSNGLVPHNNGSPSIWTRHMSSNSEVLTESATGNHNGEGITTSSSCNGGIGKQEEVKNTSCTAREVKHKV